MAAQLKPLLSRVGSKKIIFMTGAGISAESNIPTFRGEEGYWTAGSTNYHPMDLATNKAFREVPDDAWCWYLYRRTVCRAAEPNQGHKILAQLEESLGSRFLLVTQNVDGLHLRAGNSQERTYEVHGNIDFMRCWEDCCLDLFPIPDEIGTMERGQSLSSEQARLLVCPKCGARSRPHVLWFDECYDEARFRFESSLLATQRCGALVTVGSSGSTNLPTKMVHMASAIGAVLIDINPEQNPYGQMAQASGGVWLKCGAGEGLAQVQAAL